MLPSATRAAIPVRMAPEPVGARVGEVERQIAAGNSSGSRGSVLPISTNAPPSARSPADSSSSAPVSELTTTSMPRPPRKDRNRSPNPGSREEAMWSSSRPSPRRDVVLGGARGGEDLRSGEAGQADRGEADAGGGGVHQGPPVPAAGPPGRAARSGRW